MTSLYYPDDGYYTLDQPRFTNLRPQRPLKRRDFSDFHEVPLQHMDTSSQANLRHSEQSQEYTRQDYTRGDQYRPSQPNFSRPYQPATMSQSPEPHGHNKSLREATLEKLPDPWYSKYIQWMDSESKNHTVAVFGEFVGTTLFLFFAFAGTQFANFQKKQNPLGNGTDPVTGINLSALMFVSISFGFSLIVNAWIFFRISGGLFNPALTMCVWVTLALALLGALSPLRAALLAFAQVAGGCLAALLVNALYETPLDVQTTLGGGVTVTQGLLIEALCTAELVFTILMLAMEKHKATFMAPLGIGLALFIGEIVAVFHTGGSLNPARSFGPAAVLRDFDGYHWVYWVGPLLGTLLAVAFYKLVKILEYETANPGQDAADDHDMGDQIELVNSKPRGRPRHLEF